MLYHWAIMNSTPVPSADRYKRVFVTVLPTISDGQRRMLRANYRAPQHTSTPRELAEAACYQSESSVNLQYGRLAGKIAEELNFTPQETRVRNQKETFKTYTLAAWIPQGAWRLHPEVVEALASLGW